MFPKPPVFTRSAIKSFNGQSFGFDEDYEYIHGFVRLETVINDVAKLYVQGNWINSDVVFADGITYSDTQLDWSQSINAGVAFSF